VCSFGLPISSRSIRPVDTGEFVETSESRAHEPKLSLEGGSGSSGPLDGGGGGVPRGVDIRLGQHLLELASCDLVAVVGDL